MEDNKKQISHIDDELHGALLSANEKINAAGSNLMYVGIILALSIPLAIHVEWIEQLGSFSLESIRNWYSYLFIAFVCILISFILFSIPEKRAYKQYRHDISTLAAKVGLSKYELVASIEGDENLKAVSSWIKKDTSLEFTQKRGF